MTVREFEQDHITAVTLDQRPDRGHLLPEDQVAFPVTGNGAIGDLGGPFGDHHHVADPTLTDTTFRIGLGATHRPTSSQARMQLLAERSAALHEQRLIDGLVRHAHLRVVRIATQPTTPRSGSETTSLRACARRPDATAGTARASPASV